MARVRRIVTPGYPHHITQRGNRRQRTFFSKEDYRAYLRLMTVWCDRFKVSVWAADDEAILRALRCTERTGRVLGIEGFVGTLEQTLGRSLMPGKRGPKSKQN